MFNKRLQIETIRNNCNNESLVNIIKRIKNMWGFVFIPEYFIKDNKDITYFNFYLNDQLYYLQYNNIYWFSLSSVYKPSKDFWTGSSIINEATTKEIYEKLNMLPKKWFIKGFRTEKEKPYFYKNIKEFKEKSYFNLYQY